MSSRSKSGESPASSPAKGRKSGGVVGKIARVVTAVVGAEVARAVAPAVAPVLANAAATVVAVDPSLGSSPATVVAPAVTFPAATNAGRVATVGRKSKGVPGAPAYATFASLIAKSGESLTLSGLFRLAFAFYYGFSERGREYATDGSLVARIKQFSTEIAYRSLGRPSFAPYDIPGRAGGITYGDRTPDGEETLRYDPTATVVVAPPLSGSAVIPPAVAKRIAAEVVASLGSSPATVVAVDPSLGSSPATVVAISEAEAEAIRAAEAAAEANDYAATEAEAEAIRGKGRKGRKGRKSSVTTPAYSDGSIVATPLRGATDRADKLARPDDA